jgi:D-alanine-D-alanine ligase
MKNQFQNGKITVGLFFGGKSTEHEVSVITGLQAYSAMMNSEKFTAKYNCIPIYISKNNALFIGENIGKIEKYADIPALLKSSSQAVIMNKSLFEITPKKIDVRAPIATLDVALPCVHGTNVEDGALQGFLEMQNIPYAGCDVMSSAVGMDKTVQKTVLKQAGVPVLDCVSFTYGRFCEQRDSVIAEIAEKIGFPAIVKPVNLGSSIGIKIAADKSELVAALEHALMFSDKIMAERAIVNLKEINCAVLGDKDCARASECEEPVITGSPFSSGTLKILDFDDKYSGGNSKGGKSADNSKTTGMASLKRKIPADISENQREEIRSIAVKAFKALGCAGVARIDFLIDSESGEGYFNEINTIPGSLSFYLWEPLGLKYPDLLCEMLELALKRERERGNLNFSFESNILSGFSGGMGGKGGKFGSKV